MAQPELVITEIMYNPPEAGSDSLEFVEIYNAGANPIDLTGITFTQGITYDFPSTMLAPGSTFLIAVDSAAAEAVYGVPFDAQWISGGLSNGGEDLIIETALGAVIDVVDYDDGSPWPDQPDGDGPSLELLDFNLDNSVASSWVASCNAIPGAVINTSQIYATPGVVNSCLSTTISLVADVVTVSESAGSVDIEVALTGQSADSPMVKMVLTSFATADNGVDFMAMDTMMVAFAADSADQTQTISITIMDDTDAEMDEYFSIRLIDVMNADLEDATQVIYIKDDDRMAPEATNAISLNLLTSYENFPGTGDNVAEIVAFDPQSERMFLTNSENQSMDIVSMADPSNPVAFASIDISIYGGINSVAVHDTLVAVAIENDDKQLPGFIVFFDTDGNFLDSVTVGALPDMVTFTPDGSKVLTANEGEPSDDYFVDPEGSVSIVDISGGIGSLSSANVTNVALGSVSGIRLTGPTGTTAGQDIEPEYITISSDGNIAYVTCQENNAVITIDMANGNAVAALDLGSKDHSAMMAGLDATNDFDSVNIANYPLKGLYMPDAIASYEIGGNTYLITANEGDAREYESGAQLYLDEDRLKDIDLDPTAFPNGDIMQQAIGRIKIVNTEGDTDGDGDYDELYTFGARSFTIWNAADGSVAYDSGDDFELITSQDPVIGSIFNTTDDELDFKDRSDDKGPEPEGVTTGVIGGRTYAFILLERTGGVMVYDVTNPTTPEFVQYINNRSTTDETVGDLAPEGVIFISSDESPNGRPLLLVANEVSSTVGIYEITEAITGSVAFAEDQQTVGEDVDSIMVELLLTDANIDSTITVDVELGNFATADEGTDFTAAASTTVTFMPGVSSIMVKFAVADDSDAENDEYFSLRLANPSNAFLGEDTAHVAFINDNDRLAPEGSGDINLIHVTSYQNGVAGDDAAEILAYDAATQRVFLANSEANEINIVDFSDPAAPDSFLTVDVNTYGGINSVATKNGVVAAAIENDDKQMPGYVVFFDTDGNFLSQVTAGALPDMVTFTPDGLKVLVANEGEPSDDYSNDPEGSISIIDISGGAANVTQADVSTADFTAFNAQEAQLKADGVRIFGPNATVAQDLEPEYIAISVDGSTAYVTLQENNAVAVVDINAASVTAINPLGYKDHSVPGMGIDAEDREDSVRIANYPIKGMYMPDAIASFSVGGTDYLITANEGDAREYDTYEEEVRLRDEDYELDETAFPDGDLLKTAIGRITTTFASGDTDGDGDYDEVHVFGARSFSIWDNNGLVYDSGDDFEYITSQDPVFGQIFNTTDDENEFKNRSDNKGPEPEAVVVGEIEGEMYAFIGLERIGGLMVYNVTDPTAPEFVQYINTRDASTEGGDLAPEDIKLIPVNESPDGKYYVIVAYEVSSTMAVFEVEGVINSIDDVENQVAVRVYPNPAANNVSISLKDQEALELSVRVMTLEGREVMNAQRPGTFGPLELEVAKLPAGIYLLNIQTELGSATQRLIVR